MPFFQFRYLFYMFFEKDFQIYGTIFERRITMETKVCKVCGIEKEIDQFRKRDKIDWKIENQKGGIKK